MIGPFIRKLEAFGPLSLADKALLENSMNRARSVAARVDIAAEGSRPDNVHLIVDGFACRYKMLEDGRRQIVAYLLPGDFCDVHVFILKEMDHSIGTLSSCKVIDISAEQILAWTERPALARALWWATLVDEATLREWLLNVGARPAEQRIAHLLCELLLRLETVGLTDGATYELPITQNELGDTTGLTGVHVNRVLQRLRADGLITWRNQKLVILDADRLRELSGFNPNYLHLSRARRVNGHH